jgi:vancomycin permeability regulator SanA
MINAKYNAVILLGGSVNNDGSLSADAKAQVEKAAALYVDKVVKNIITCGSHGYKNEWRPAVTEAQGYADYAQKLGVPAGSIYLEEQSQETIGSMYFAKKILLDRGWKRVVIIPAINHSTQRVVYITNKILGPDYVWKILRAKENLDMRNIIREQTSLRSTREINGMIPDGDHEATYRILCQTHPAYGGTKYSLEELKSFLDVK